MLKTINSRVGYISPLYSIDLRLVLSRAKTTKEAKEEYNKIVDQINKETDKAHKKGITYSLCLAGVILVTTLLFSQF